MRTNHSLARGLELTGCFAWWRCSGPGHARARGWFPGESRGLPRRAVEWAGAVRADGEDEVGRDGGAGRVVLAARVAEHRAHRVGARRGRARGVEGRGTAEDRSGAAGAGPRAGRRGRAGRCRSPPRGRGTCWTPWTAATGCWAWTTAAGGDEVFRLLALARVIEPASKLDSLRVLDEAGIAAPSYATVKRRLPAYAKEEWRQRLSAACAAHARLGPASLVLYDVSTLVLRDGPGRRVPRARLLEGTAAGAADHDRAARRPGRVPADALGVRGRQGRDQDRCCRSSRQFMTAHQLPDVTVVADAGMISDANMKAIEAAGPVVHLGHEGPRRPLRHRPVAAGAPGRGHPRRARLHAAVARRAEGQAARPGHLLHTTSADRARRTLHGIDEQVKKAAEGRRRPGPGQAQPVHPARGGGQERQPRTGG